MKLSTVLDLIRSGQLGLMLRLQRSFTELYRAAFIATALKEGLYARLNQGPASLDELHAHLTSPAGQPPFSPQHLEAWLALGVSLGELRRGPDGRYALRSRLSRRLADPAYDAQQAILQEVAGLHYALVTQTPARLRLGHRFTLAESDGELIARSSRILEPFVCEAVDQVLGEITRSSAGSFSAAPIHLLEVGCGSGVYIRHACRRSLSLTAVGLELQPEVAEFARRNLDQWGLSERVTVEACDVRNYTPARLFDLVTLHNNIYYFPESTRDALLRHLAGFLKPGGRLLLTSECQGGGVTGQVLNLWAVMTDGTGALPYPHPFCEQLRLCGFTDVFARSLLPGDSFYMFVGTKT